MPDNGLSNIEKASNWFQKRWGGATLYVVCTSLIGLFFFSIVYDKSVNLQAVNGWVSLILGFVATLLSIISMILSFYNLEKSNELNQQNSDLIQKMLNMQVAITEKVNAIHSDTTRYLMDGYRAKPVTIPNSGTWEKQ
jgi:hypothetical protein